MKHDIQDVQDVLQDTRYLWPQKRTLKKIEFVSMRLVETKWVSSLRLSPACALLLPFFALVALTVTIFVPLGRCGDVVTVHRAIEATLNELRPETLLETAAQRIKRPDPEIMPLLWRLRSLSTQFLNLRDRVGKSGCGKLPQLRRRGLEFSLGSRYHTDGVLLYLFSVLGSTRRTLVEIDGARGDGVFGAGSVLVYAYNWTAYNLLETWTAYEATRVFYEQADSRVTVIDAGRVRGHTAQLAQQHAFGGSIDFAAVFPGGGDELSLLRELGNGSRQMNPWIRPRIISLFFQDFWGHADRSRESNDSVQLGGAVDGIDIAHDRLFVGGSLPALVRVARTVNYRLVWCLTSAPVAFFADQSVGVGKQLLPTQSVNKCMKIRISPKWRRDAEAMWDEAQSYRWKSP